MPDHKHVESFVFDLLHFDTYIFPNLTRPCYKIVYSHSTFNLVFTNVPNNVDISSLLGMSDHLVLSFKVNFNCHTF